MAPKPDCSLFSATLLVLIAVFPLVSNATTNSSSFQFLEHLKGCRKGDKVKGINNVKKYLHKFGYLDHKNHIHSDDFDKLLEEAVQMYQLNFHLDSTGMLDDETISTMMMPRCGMPDIVNGTTSMRSSKHLHYSFPSGNPKWSPTKYSLTYGFLAGTPSEAMQTFPKAFTTWSKASPFKFSKAASYEKADLKISFVKRAHGDQYPFEGPGGYLAHAFYPTDGRFHVDAEEKWSVGAKPGFYELETIATHEIGHLMGLDHSQVKTAIMYPIIPEGVVNAKLQPDDIQGIKALYPK